MLSSLYHIFRNECPNCHKGKVFADKSFFFSFGFPKMHEHCSHCNFKFEKEPGYFFGAMFVNYGLTVGQGIITYLIASQFFDETFDLRIIPIIGVVIVLLSCFNIRLSRMIWIYMFKNYSM
ncbi:DUF983 domain-containing protein [Flavobacterium sp. 102]|uniref:DUF983 domain-containing protein n=1 Tax=Flavobacterium sp. 102 TaxID=2135623 RepID=UPI000EACF109|nr:DUF983 domain-containing protein [Flavobacterium sp. 102]RKS02412.1 uncharacterized protein DUF983 [Flavobacterium sp. 102]